MSRLIDEDSFPETWKRTKEEQERLKGQKHKVMNALHPDCAGCGTGDLDTHGDHVNDPPAVQRSGMGTANG